jgi:hypothetical protein
MTIHGEKDRASARWLFGPKGRWVAWAAGLWALVFGVFHIIWAAGWYPLLDAEEARAMFAVRWKWTYDVVVAAMCLVAVPVALAPVMSWGTRLPHRLVYTVAWIGTALVVIRSVLSLGQAAYLIAIGRFRFADMGIWEPWFYLGAILFGLSTWRSKHAHLYRIA